MGDLVLFPARPKVLRPYQSEALASVLSLLERGKRPVLKLPTGAGKTLMASSVARHFLERGRRVLFTSPRTLLVDQTIAAFEAEGISGIGAMQGNHPRTDPTAPVQVATVQTLLRRGLPPTNLVIVDEIHERSTFIHEVMDRHPDIAFLGLSATPWAKGLGLRWTDLVRPVTVSQLIADGHLSEFIVYAPDNPDLRGVGKSTFGEFVESDVARIMGEKRIVANVVQTWLAKGEDRPTFAFCVNRAHAAQVRQQFERAGISAGYVDLNTDPVEMAGLERRFRAGEIRVMCSVIKMTTGVDWPVSCIVDAAPTNSEMRHVQKIGRGLRKNPGTEDLLVLDHAGNTLRLGLVTDIDHDHLDTSKPGERRTRPAALRLPCACTACGALHSGLVCPACGHERKPPTKVRVIEGDLVPVTERLPADDTVRFFAMAKFYGAERGYKPGFAAAIFREKFGSWPPPGMNPEPLEPDRAFINYQKSRRIAYARAKAKARGEFGGARNANP